MYRIKALERDIPLPLKPFSIETPSNPLLASPIFVDVEVAKRRSYVTIADDTFMTPILAETPYPWCRYRS